MHFPLRVLAILLVSSLAAADPTPLDWQPWRDDLFSRATEEKRLVLLDLGATWCHWCHVMDETTYRDGAVVALLREHFLTVRVDQDANPDLANRYQDYGWPATIVFAADGSEIVRRRGYLPPPAMASMLAAIVEDPSPGPSVTAEREVSVAREGRLSPERRRELEERHRSVYDGENAGWGSFHKLIDADSLEYALLLAQRGDAEEQRRARATLDAARNLLDPVWGGFYQYSDRADWKSPHYEKILSIQAETIRLHVRAGVALGEPRDLGTARAVAGYVTSFLTSPEGVFLPSQDADLVPGEHSKGYFELSDGARRAQGVPRVDRNRYARENGWMIEAMAELSDLTGDPAPLVSALRAARWIVDHRSAAGGGFRHGETDDGRLYLGDTLAMGRAFLALYTSTADRRWLERAAAAADFARSRFVDSRGGFAGSTLTRATTGVLGERARDIDENISLARFANRLFHHTGKAEHRAMADEAMRYLAAPDLTDTPRFLTGVLLADEELTAQPLHVTVVGTKSDAAAASLFQAARATARGFRRIEWWDRAEGALPRSDVTYPKLARSAAFLCADGVCSTPIFDPERLARMAKGPAAGDASASRGPRP